VHLLEEFEKKKPLPWSQATWSREPLGKYSKKSSDFKENSFEVVKIFWRIWGDL
jgi:hypothetical protein